MSLLELKSISKSYKKGCKSVDKFSLKINENQIIGLVGESGCGKSTIANIIMRLQNFDEGEVSWMGLAFENFSKDDLKEYRKNVQIVFQNVLTSLNPKMRVLDIVAEPLRNFSNLDKKQIEQKVIETLQKVGLEKEDIYKIPKEFSGGQRQRIAIARAIITNPKLIVLDEATSSLDVSVQSQILNLLNDLKKEFNTSYLFISHDLGVVRYISDITYVMYKGSNIEIIESENLLTESRHPYTNLLLESVPVIGEKNLIKRDIKCCDTKGDGACKFYCRCSRKKEVCKNEKVYLREISDVHKIACHLYK